MPEKVLEELSTDECWSYLEGKTVGRLAVSVAGKPDIFPVNYRVTNKSILIRTAAGFKLAAATLGEAVAFEVDHLDQADHTGWSVVIRGEATELHAPQVFDAEELDIQPWASGHKGRYIRIEPGEITGRRIPLGEPES